MLCTLVVAQMLPEAVAVKGGMGIKLRLGEAGTRATSDLDVSTFVRGDESECAFRARLSAGWGWVPPSKGQRRRDLAAADRTAFHGSLRAGQIYDPGLNRPEYVVHPYRVSLTFLGRPWGGLDVEVSDPEIDPQAHTPHEIDNDLVEFGARFGFDALRPVELVDLEYQVAQKIHAVTNPAYERAHDLVDLQLLWTSQLEMRRLREMCIRTFRWRNQQSWPPLPLRDMTGWARAYAEAREETQVDGRTEVLLKLVDAREWLADMIQSIHADVR